MNYFLSFVFTISIIFSINAQTASDTIVSLERVPIFPGCNKFTENSDLVKCMSDSFKKFIGKKFNARVADTLDINPGRITIKTWFKINKKGEVTDVNVVAPDPALEKETKRVLALLPRILPGELNGEKVTVPYYFPIYMTILGDAKENRISRREKRKLLRKAKKIVREMN